MAHTLDDKCPRHFLHAITANPLRASTTSIRGVFVDNSMGLIYDCFLVSIRFTHLLAGFSK